MAISARRIHPLRFSGIVEIRDKVTAKTMQDPRVYGREEHYVWTKCWGAESGRHEGGLGISVTRPTPALLSGLNPDGTERGSGVIDDGVCGVADLPKLSDCLTITNDVIPPVDLPVPPHLLLLDLVKYAYKKRTEDKAHWPKPNPKAITSRRSLAAMMMTRLVTGLIAKEGLIPVIVSPNKIDSRLSVRTPFGPMLDDNSRPVKAGKVMLAATVYNQYRLKQGKGFNDAWNPDIWQAGGAIFRLPEKNGLPIDRPIATGMSQLGEIIRLSEGSTPTGFFSLVQEGCLL